MRLDARHHAPDYGRCRANGRKAVSSDRHQKSLRLSASATPGRVHTFLSRQIVIALAIALDTKTGFRCQVSVFDIRRSSGRCSPPLSLAPCASTTSGSPLARPPFSMSFPELECRKSEEADERGRPATRSGRIPQNPCNHCKLRATQTRRIGPSMGAELRRTRSLFRPVVRAQRYSEDPLNVLASEE